MPRRRCAEGALHAFNDEGKLVYGKLTIDHLALVAKAFAPNTF